MTTQDKWTAGGTLAICLVLIGALVVHRRHAPVRVEVLNDGGTGLQVQVQELPVTGQTYTMAWGRVGGYTLADAQWVEQLLVSSVGDKAAGAALVKLIEDGRAFTIIPGSTVRVLTMDERHWWCRVDIVGYPIDSPRPTDQPLWIPCKSIDPINLQTAPLP